MKTYKEVFLSNFNKLTFARLFSLNVSSKSPWATA